MKQALTTWGGWPNCIHISNGEIELIATTAVGPRIMRFGFVGGQNFLKEYAEQLGKTGGDEWRIYGGHRLWHAPEAIPRTYWPDNAPLAHEWEGDTLKLSQPVEPTTGIQKELEITMDAAGSHVTVLHRLINRNLWEIETAAWAMSVVAPGGRAIFPQEEYRPHPEYLLPARPIVLWHYTNMSDPRWTWGEKFIQLRQDPSAKTKQKVGFYNSKGWAAYELAHELWFKRYDVTPDGKYPDYGCNTETFTDANMLEIETLSPLTRLAPGACLEHTEEWFLYKLSLGVDEAGMEKALASLG
ncbi:hypothetical protein HS125_04720 [bacterium]|nr:hypothetical protein [bacterium]